MLRSTMLRYVALASCHRLARGLKFSRGQFWVSLQDAVNLTSKLLKDVSEMQNSGLKTNILVSCEKLEKFVLHYASLHMTLQNGSETELSMEQQEMG